MTGLERGLSAAAIVTGAGIVVAVAVNARALAGVLGVALLVILWLRVTIR